MRNLKILVGLVFLATLLIGSGNKSDISKIYYDKEKARLIEFRKYNSGGVLSKKAEALVGSTNNAELIGMYGKLSGENKDVIDVFISKIEFKVDDGELYRNEKHKNRVHTGLLARTIKAYMTYKKIFALYNDKLNGRKIDIPASAEYGIDKFESKFEKLKKYLKNEDFASREIANAKELAVVLDNPSKEEYKRLQASYEKNMADIEKLDREIAELKLKNKEMDEKYVELAGLLKMSVKKVKNLSKDDLKKIMEKSDKNIEKQIDIIKTLQKAKESLEKGIKDLKDKKNTNVAVNVKKNKVFIPD